MPGRSRPIRVITPGNGWPNAALVSRECVVNSRLTIKIKLNLLAKSIFRTFR